MLNTNMNVYHALLYLVWADTVSSSPNIIVFIVDDLGIGDIGCYGNTTINTPTIDALQKEGVKLVHNLAAASLCTPSRAALLTGRYANRIGYANPSNKERFVTLYTSASGGLPPQELTFATLLKTRNYTNGYFGKWHLGVHCDEQDFCHFPLRHGFDHYYGMPLTNMLDCGKNYLKKSEIFQDVLITNKHFPNFCIVGFFLLFSTSGIYRKCSVVLFMFCFTLWSSHIMKILFYQQMNCVLMRNYDVIQQPVRLENLTVGLTEEVKGFIKKNADRHFMAVVSYHNVHTALESSVKYRGKSNHGIYGDSVEETDGSMREILSLVDALELNNNTFVYFTSDHGPALYMGMEGGSKGTFKGGKGSCWEGGIRVPTILKWPGKLPSNFTYKYPTSGLDLLPTLANVAGVNLPDVKTLDGRDIISQVLGNHQERFLFHYCGTSIHAVTYSSLVDLKVLKVHYVVQRWPENMDHCVGNSCKCFGDSVTVLKVPQLYDMQSDPSEGHPLDSSTDLYREVVEKCTAAVERHKLSVQPVENQLVTHHNSFSWKRQMCCNFPLCSC